MALYTIGVLHGPKTSSSSSVRIIDDVTESADAWVASDDCPARDMIAHGVYRSVDEALRSLVIQDVEIICAAHDACYNRVKASYDVFPSARASQAIAKCRKSHGNVRHGKAGKNLKRWEREKWKDKITGKPCGHEGGGKEYCRPTKRVSKKTPKMYKGKELRSKISKKQAGLRAT